MMDFPGKDLIKDPMLELYYDIEIEAAPEEILIPNVNRRMRRLFPVWERHKTQDSLREFIANEQKTSVVKTGQAFPVMDIT